jgi:hypothetical protein
MKTQHVFLGLAAIVTAAAPASATQYFMSGNACQPTDPTNATKLRVLGAGITNSDPTSGSLGTATCPVVGVTGTLIQQTTTGVLKVQTHNTISGFWELDTQALTTFWWSSNKISSAGNQMLTWSGSELWGSGSAGTTANSAYSFRATINGRCLAGSCAPDQSWLNAYWITNI